MFAKTKSYQGLRKRHWLSSKIVTLQITGKNKQKQLKFLESFCSTKNHKESFTGTIFVITVRVLTALIVLTKSYGFWAKT
jgi:hypothetical protein